MIKITSNPENTVRHTFINKLGRGFFAKQSKNRAAQRIYFFFLISGWYVTLISGHLCNAGANTNAIVAVTVAFCIRTSCSTSCSLLLIASATSWAAKLAKISCTQLAVKFHSLNNTVQDKTRHNYIMHRIMNKYKI